MRTRALRVGLLAVSILALWAAVADAAGLYVSDAGSSVIYPLAIAADGSTALRTPANLPTTQDPIRVAITPDGAHVYTSAYSPAAAFSQFGVTATGALAALTPATVPATKSAAPIVVSPNGRNVYAAAYTGSGYVIDQFTVGATGTLTAMTPATVPSEGQDDIVMTPDGRHLYLSNFGAPGLIEEYDVGPTGALTAHSPASITTPNFPLGMTVSPNGKYLYVGLDNSTLAIGEYSIGAEGTLAAQNPSQLLLPANTYPNSLTVSPDGGNLYLGDAKSPGGGVQQYTIAGNGQLAAMSPLAVGTDSVGNLLVSPTGRTLYGTTEGSTSGTRTYTVGPGGALTATANLTASGSGAAGIAITPDQGPIASFTVAPAAAGSATVFNGAASSDPDGSVVAYRWSFGDGQTATTTTPIASHVYAQGGAYSASLVVVDNDGASDELSSNGHQVIWNAGPQGSATRAVAVPAAPASSALRPSVITRLAITPRKFRVGQGKKATASVAGKVKSGAVISFRLDVGGQLTTTVLRRRSGHRHGRHCSTSAKEGKHCVVWKPVKGSEQTTGVAGPNRIAFSGRFAGRKLRPGSYRVVLTPSAGSVTGKAVSVGFTILP